MRRKPGKDARMIELVLQNRIACCATALAQLVEHKLGFVHANAGIDQSNLPDNSDSETALLLPENPMPVRHCAPHCKKSSTTQRLL
ncbi:MAG: hypothetical protein R3E67_02495 [Pseudomonadales bacterium]